MKHTITFQTSCWEKDWFFILRTPYLAKMISRCNVDFDRKELIINNVKDRARVAKYAQIAVGKGIIDGYYFADDYVEDALKALGLTRSSFINEKTKADGYYYSISNLVGIYLCQSHYLMRFASDTMLDCEGQSWVKEAIDIMDANPQVAVATATWNRLFDQAFDESFDGLTIGNFWVAQGFSDQCHLVRISEFKSPIYNHSHPYSERYPKYGGELFEKMIDAWMRNNDKQRIISTKDSYNHRNFPKSKIKRCLRFIEYKLNHF